MKSPLKYTKSIKYISSIQEEILNEYLQKVLDALRRYKEYSYYRDAQSFIVFHISFVLFTRLSRFLLTMFDIFIDLNAYDTFPASITKFLYSISSRFLTFTSICVFTVRDSSGKRTIQDRKLLSKALHFRVLLSLGVNNVRGFVHQTPFSSTDSRSSSFEQPVFLVHPEIHWYRFDLCFHDCIISQ